MLDPNLHGTLNIAPKVSDTVLEKLWSPMRLIPSCLRQRPILLSIHLSLIHIYWTKEKKNVDRRGAGPMDAPNGLSLIHI